METKKVYLILAVLAVIAIATFIGIKSTSKIENGRLINLQQIGVIVSKGELPKNVFYLAVFEKLKNPKTYFIEKNKIIYVYKKSKYINLTGKNSWYYTVYREDVLRGRVILKNKNLTFVDVCLNPVSDKYFSIKVNFSKSFANLNNLNKVIKIKILYNNRIQYINLTNKDLAITSTVASQIISESKKSNLSKEYEIELVTYGLGSAVSKVNNFALDLSKFPFKLTNINESKYKSKFEKILIFGSNAANYPEVPNVDSKSLNIALLDSAVLNYMGYNTAILVKNSKAYLLIKNVKLVYPAIKIKNCTYYVYDPLSGYPISTQQL